MNELTSKNTLSTIAELEAIYGEPVGQSLVKEIDYISEHYKVFIEKSPFLVLASVAEEGLDCSPRGDPAGFVRVVDEKTVMIPDRRGNNRIDTLRNIVRDPRVITFSYSWCWGNSSHQRSRGDICGSPPLRNLRYAWQDTAQCHHHYRRTSLLSVPESSHAITSLGPECTNRAQRTSDRRCNLASAQPG